MEFYEKLQELRKARNMTQEELAEALYVSRTAVSKWEQGRGYPSLDSLKEISTYFGVTIDDLLSGDVLISIAEKDNKMKLRKTYDLLFGCTDLFIFALIILPLYPQAIEGYVYSVNLLAYNDIATHNLCIYRAMYVVLFVTGIIKLLILKFRPEKDSRMLSGVSIVLSVITLIILTLSRETYAAVLMIIMLVIKITVLMKQDSINRS